MELYSDKSLVNLISESNYKAFTVLYDRYWRQLYRIALSKTGNEEDALDIVQEFFIDFWNRREALKIEKSVDNYLVSALFHKIFMHFRKKGLEEKHLQNYTYFISQLDGDTLASNMETEHEEAYTELIGLVTDTIEQMPEKMKQVFDLKHRQSLSIAEIAGIMGISTQTVKNQLSNAMIKLRKSTEKQVPGAASSLFLIWLFS
ncbi:RNA polymerase sigma factor [Pedobacter metabolipauper]|uniref:RNA polymerase sigma-70 factor (ECF subfamily) n=1 Tax=Pedobacter metabolipauper TaxID=425513 RepID=A0A4R6SV34_9SPHI|nr:sigma-70 family RNA polymerase sigma factor [Pedobacter metabolipauper]TDQ08893.1 RNA polymerase sigma-70 factor (ECF subfamily) [Pedobacter metabolipauper]